MPFVSACVGAACMRACVRTHAARARMPRRSDARRPTIAARRDTLKGALKDVRKGARDGARLGAAPGAGGFPIRAVPSGPGAAIAPDRRTPFARGRANVSTPISRLAGAAQN
ncbi:hypothetical protein [Burkholderia pseudomallei]|uniref:hypothetical protein n=1 Tax=Burkholderia pseudomallei TaxID=28450 RepID=UPI0002F694F0|nr:hypothetical protein [Burkholderia pseudomallei]MBD2942674.1 hypothetical protein [Burkholderia pseudomallei]MBD2950031.1 hypothetical protein [Burkholderia pseudomallei]MBD2987242.1 hypothetical protein [Burkholderia pseudomallei]MBD2995639.1 hypothetical protein [Burkholderia pseudomallei]